MSAATLADGGVFASTTNTDERLIHDLILLVKYWMKRERVLLNIYYFSGKDPDSTPRGKMDVMDPNEVKKWHQTVGMSSF